MDMIRAGRLEAVLVESDGLPAVGSSKDREPLPAFANVANRLKIMANLDPVMFPVPRDGTICLIANSTPFDIFVRFEDQGARRIHLRIQKVPVADLGGTLPAAFAKVTRALPAADPEFVLRTLVSYSSQMLSGNELDDPNVQQILKVVDEEWTAATLTFGCGRKAGSKSSR